MLFRKPKLSCDLSCTSFEMLKDAIAQYGIETTSRSQSDQLKSLKMDDVDFLEALQLIEKLISARINKEGIGPSTTLEEVVALIDRARR
jgi:hypothetical protein